MPSTWHKEFCRSDCNWQTWLIQNQSLVGSTPTFGTNSMKGNIGQTNYRRLLGITNPERREELRGTIEQTSG